MPLGTTNTRAVNTALTQGSIPAALYRMSWPMVVGLLATMSFNVADAFFVSGLGEHALIALSFGFPIVMLAISLFIGLGAGASSAVAIAAGKGDENEVRALVSDGLLLTAIITIVLSVIAMLTITELFTLLGASAQVLPYIQDYMLIWYAGVLFFAVQMVGFSSMRALGNTALQGKVMIGTALLNVVLDPILIYGWGVVPALGIKGAAIATLAMQVLSAAIVLYYMRVRMNLLINPFHKTRTFQSWKKILHVGVPAMATNMIIPVSGTLIVAIVAAHGEQAVAGIGVAGRIEAVMLVTFYALSAVIGPFCGQNLGAGNFKRLYAVQKTCLVYCMGFGLFGALILAASGAWLASFFSDQADVIKAAQLYLLVVPISHMGHGVVMFVNASFNGLRKPMPGMAISTARVVVLLFPLIWLGQVWFDFTGIFVAISVANLISGLYAYLWVRRTIRQLELEHTCSV
ncbi:MAG: MATE family efflux transporter [Alteromonadaceae bacterium]|nr:MAG: MATE family efflux transporter [Alteromonadaceae bacterium]